MLAGIDDADSFSDITMIADRTQCTRSTTTTCYTISRLAAKLYQGRKYHCLVSSNHERLLCKTPNNSQISRQTCLTKSGLRVPGLNGVLIVLVRSAIHPRGSTMHPTTVSHSSTNSRSNSMISRLTALRARAPRSC